MADKQSPEEVKSEFRWQKYARYFTGGHLLKFTVLSICSVVVVQQVSDCIDKLLNTPISTYTHFEFNKTLQYPSLTFCREPPYKFFNLLKHGLYAHPRYTSTWRHFDFNKTSLDDLWDDITYNESEVFLAYGLDGLASNVEVTSTLSFVNGRCFTVSPKILVSRATRYSGYSITLQHSASDVAHNTGNFPAGYHVYVHYTKEPFTEVEVYNGGLVDYLHLKTSESIDVKLAVDEYTKLSTDDNKCLPADHGYSTNACTSQCVWNQVVEAANCSGPWMVTDFPPCRNHSQMTSLISTYIRLYQQHVQCRCPRLCHSHLYNAFVVDRHSYTWDVQSQSFVPKRNANDLQIQLFVYFNGMMVSMYEERYNYDWTVFIADFGGSVGFLLGITVVTLLRFMGKGCDLLMAKVSPSTKPATPTPEQDFPPTTNEVKRKFTEWNSTHIGNFI